MKKVFAILIGALAMLGVGVGISSAEPGPNGNNDHGLCTAYFNGQKVGHGPGEDQDNQPPPFQGLEDAAEAHTQDDGENNDRDLTQDSADSDEAEQLTDAENIYNYCTDLSTIGGNPEHGRFTCVATGGSNPADTDSDSDPECSRNEKPGKG